MKNRRNYYRVLHVQPDAPKEIIRSSYRTMLQKMRLHPDLGGDSGPAAEINEAYSTLTDPRSRAAYDRTGQFPERAKATRVPEAGGSQLTCLADAQCAFCSSTHEHEGIIPRRAMCSNCSSPLAPPETLVVQERGRRAIVRVPNEQPLIFCTHWPQSEPLSGRTKDISLTGMKFIAGISLAQGQIIKVDAQILRAVGRIAHSRKHRAGWEIGVQFVSLFFEQPRGSFIRDRA